jgi:hypothetical protein
MLCFLCRSSCNRSELTYVYGRLGEGGNGEEEHGAGAGGSKALEEEVEVKGSYSTKIVALGIVVLWYHYFEICSTLVPLIWRKLWRQCVVSSG